MRVYGLTGNIGSGKSTVAGLFTKAGVPVVDADQIARDVVAKGTPGLAAVAQRFPQAIAADGQLDRKALAARVFADAAERKALQDLLHPLIAAESARRFTELAEGGGKLALYEATLLVENGQHRGLAGLIVVTAPELEQVKRVMMRDGSTEDEVRQRLAAQMPSDEKVRHATFVIDNRGSPQDLQAQVDRVLASLHAHPAPARSP